MAVDERFYKNASSFEGFRFAEKKSDAATGHSFVDTEAENLSWGFGRYTCPGRWYASAMMKLFVSILLLQYDFKFLEGQTSRLPNKKRDTEIVPDFAQEIRIMVRQDVTDA